MNIMLKEEVAQTDWTGVWPLAELGRGLAPDEVKSPMLDSASLHTYEITMNVHNAIDPSLSQLYLGTTPNNESGWVSVESDASTLRRSSAQVGHKLDATTLFKGLQWVFRGP
jgi:hypothetical protein